MCAKRAKICHFYAEIAKFGLILIYLKFILEGDNWGKENIGENAPYSPVTPPLVQRKEKILIAYIEKS